MLLLIHVPTGKDINGHIEEQARLRGIANAAIVSLIGAVDNATISYMDRDHNDVNTTLMYPLELSGTGEIVDTKAHIHCTVSGKGGILHGHLHNATVGPFHVNAYIQAL